MSPLARTNDRLIERVLVWRAAKAHPEMSGRQLADLRGKPETSVRRALKLRENTPRELLEAVESEAVTAWQAAIPIAARKGDHRPAKDLLLHTRAIQPVADTQVAPLQIIIGQLFIPGVSPLERDTSEQIVSNFIDCASSVAAASDAPGLPAPTVEEGTRGGSG